MLKLLLLCGLFAAGLAHSQGGCGTTTRNPRTGLPDCIGSVHGPTGATGPTGPTGPSGFPVPTAQAVTSGVTTSVVIPLNGTLTDKSQASPVCVTSAGVYTLAWTSVTNTTTQMTIDFSGTTTAGFTGTCTAVPSIGPVGPTGPTGPTGASPSSAFSVITSATNSSAAMIVGTGASLTISGSGTINATSLGGTAATSYALLAAPTFTGLVTVGSLIVSGGAFLNSFGDIFALAGRSIGWSGTTSRLKNGSADGNIVMYNSAESSFGILQLGGTSSSFPGIKRSSAAIEFRLADDSAYTTVRASNYISNDGSTGITGATCSSFKNGICVAP